MSGVLFEPTRFPPLRLFLLLLREIRCDLTSLIFCFFVFFFFFLFLPRLLFFVLLPLRALLPPPLPLEVCSATDGDSYFGVFLSMEACAISANCSVGLMTFSGMLLVLTGFPPNVLRLSSTSFDLFSHGDDFPAVCLKWSTQGCELIAAADLNGVSIVKWMYTLTPVGCHSRWVLVTTPPLYHKFLQSPRRDCSLLEVPVLLLGNAQNYSF